nr:ribonuclease H-like domain-containing protein [Tanacetum cinerariifolium]
MSQTSIMHGIRAGGNTRPWLVNKADRDSKEICVANYDKEKHVNVQIVVRCSFELCILVNADEKKLHTLVVIMCAENKKEMCAVKTNYPPNRKHALNDEKPGVHLVSHSSVCEPTPPTAEWLTIDSIVLTWIFTTLSKTVQQRLVVENPTTTKEDWTILALIFNDNKRSRSIALKAELRSMKLGDLRNHACFRKIESITTILSSLGSPISNDDVDPFPDLKTIRSMLTTAKFQLKSWAQDTLIDSTPSSPMVLLPDSDTNAWLSTPSTKKVHRQCFNSKKGSCCFGAYCKFFHNRVHGNPSMSASHASGSIDTSSSSLTQHDIMTLQGIMAKLRCTGSTNIAQPMANNYVQTSSGISPIRLYISNDPVPPYGFNPTPFIAQPTTTGQVSPMGQPINSIQIDIDQPVHGYQPVQQPGVLGCSGQLSGLETILLNAFTIVTLQDPYLGNWNMDTGASSHHNDFISSLKDVFNLCIYSSVSVGDGYSKPVTNSSHNILSTPHRPLHLDNVLITPNIVKNLIFIRQFVHDNSCTIEFDAFGFSVKDFLTRRVLIRCDSTGDLYLVTKPSNIPHAFLTSVYTWHQRLDIQEYLADGTLSRYKARLIANGSTQIEGINADETFSPVFKPSTIQTPPGFWDYAHPDYVCLLQRSLYGLKQVCLYMHDPWEPRFSALKRILRYDRGTLDYGLQLFSSSTTDLVTYSDAHWAGYPTTLRSTSEVENRGVANSVAETCWLRNLLHELHTPLSFVTLIHCDNVSAVNLSSNLVQHQRTKHIEIYIHFVRDLVAASQVHVFHVPSRYQYADVFTKGLPSALFEEFRTSLSVRCPPAQTAKEC